LRYVVSRLYKHEAETAYRIYVTDALQAISENTAHSANGGKMMNSRWYDIIHPPKKIPEDTRSCKEVTISVWKNMTKVKKKKGGK
jgi:hypothetical protein